MATAPTTYIVHGMYLGDAMLMFFATQDEAAQWINDVHEFSDGGEVNLQLASVVGIDYDAIDGDASVWSILSADI